MLNTSQKKLVRRILLIILITFLYTCLRTFHAYRKLIISRNENTAVSFCPPCDDCNKQKMEGTTDLQKPVLLKKQADPPGTKVSFTIVVNSNPFRSFFNNIFEKFSSSNKN